MDGVDVLKINILGVAFDNLTLPEAVQEGERLMRREGLSYVVTPNPEIVNLAREDASYGKLLNEASLVLPDGIGIIYAARLQKKNLTQRVPGIDFATALLGKMEEQGERLFLLGAKSGVAEKAAVRLQERYPRLVICGTQDGYFKEDAPVIAKIKEAKADVVFVCLGAPKQEKWICTCGEATGAKLMLGLGGVLDVFSGEVQRAPEIWQKMGMEWCYRLLHQPSRFGRMAKLPLFLLSAWKTRGKD